MKFDFQKRQDFEKLYKISTERSQFIVVVWVLIEYKLYAKKLYVICYIRKKKKTKQQFLEYRVFIC